jgi:hypothetical protein
VSKLSPSQMLASLDDACAGHCAPVHPGDAQAAGSNQYFGHTLSGSQADKCSQPDIEMFLAEARADIGAFLQKREVTHRVEQKDGFVFYGIDRCPNNPEHKQSGFLLYPNADPRFKCFHDSCSEYDFVRAVVAIATGSDDGIQSMELQPKLEALNKNHAVVNLSGKFAILKEVTDPITKLRKTNFSSVNDFNNFQKNNLALEWRGKTPKLIPVADRWLRWPSRREVKGVVFEPGRQVPGYYNQYQGLAVEPKAGDCSLFIDHILQIIADGDIVLANYLLAWMADIVQNPGGPRSGTAIALRGIQGCGKGVFVRYLGKLFGPHFLHLSGSEQLTGRFNEHLNAKILVFADEAVWAGDKSAEGKLKAMITEPDLFVEPKGLNGFTISNYMRLILASNNDWIVPAGLEERRFLVLNVSSTRAGDFEYFASIANQMDNGGLEAWLHHLLNLDLSGVNLRQIPRTRALFDQMLNSMSSFEKFWLDRLSGGRLFEMLINRILAPGENLREKYDVPWPDEVLVTDLCNEFQLFCREMNVRYRSTAKQMGKSLSQICPPVQRKRHSTGPRDYYYQIPSLELCREAFEARVKMTIDWS